MKIVTLIHTHLLFVCVVFLWKLLLNNVIVFPHPFPFLFLCDSPLYIGQIVKTWPTLALFITYTLKSPQTS